MAFLAAAVSAISGFVTSTLAAGGMGAFFLRAGLSIALSVVSQILLRPKPPPPSGIRTDSTLTGGVNPEGLMVGRYASEGALVSPPMSHGTAGKTPNAYLNYVVELAGIPGHELESLIVDGREAPILEDSPHPDYGKRLGGDFLGKAWVRYHDGTQTEADAMLVAKYPAPYVRPWTADMVGSGICYMVLTFLFDRELYRGSPRFRAILKGLRFYDIRKDTTAGGDGPHRLDDPSTWEWTANNKVIEWNILHGIEFPGGQRWGGGAAPEDLTHEVWAAAMDACDAPVDDGDEGTEPAFEMGFEILADDEPFEVLEESRKASLSTLIDRGGSWYTRVGAPGLPVLFITDADILVDRPRELDPFPRPDETYNAITATYVDPESLWENRDAPPLYNAAWEAEDDGRRLPAEVSLPTVTRATQAQRVMSALAKENRRMARHVISLRPNSMVLQAGDVISWTSARNSYEARLFEVWEAQRDARSGIVALSLREVDADDYIPPAELVLPGAPVTTPDRGGIRTIAASDWSLSGVDIVDGAAAARRPALLIGWDPETVQDARHVEYQVQVNSGVYPLATSGIASARDTQAVVMSGIIAGTAYRVRLRPEIVGRETAWSDWKNATAPSTLLTDDDIADGSASVLASAFSASEVVLDRPSGGTGTVNAQITAVTLEGGINVELFVTLRLEVTCLASNLPVGILISASGPGASAIEYTPQIKNFFAANGRTEIVAVSANIAIPAAGVWNFQIAVRAFDTIDPGKAYTVKVSSRSLMVLWRKL